MALQPIIQTENYRKIMCEKTVQTVVECKFIQGEDVGDVLGTFAQVNEEGCEMADGRLHYNGKLVATIVYRDDMGKLCRMQKGVEFHHHVDDDAFAPAQTVQCQMQVVKTQLKRDGSSSVVNCIVSARFIVFCMAERSYVTDGGSAVCLKQGVQLYSATPFSGMGEVEDYFDAEDVTDVLCHTAFPLVSNCVCKGGEVQVNGEVLLNVLAIRKGEPITLERTVPFAINLLCDDAVSEEHANCMVAVKDCAVTARVNEEKGKCELEVQLDLTAQGVYMAPNTVNVVADAFDPRWQLQLQTEREQISLCQEVRVWEEHIHSPCLVKAKLGEDCQLKAIVMPMADITVNGKDVQGAIVGTLLYSREGELFATEVTLPVSLTMPQEDCQGVTVAVCRFVMRRQDKKEFIAEATVKFSACVTQYQDVVYVCQMEQGEAKPEQKHALSVLLPQRGDDLWAVAKRLDQSPEQVTQTNPDLSFPLTGEERIVVFRQKTK